jgi:alpha-tubulin suppressor-like RCC1 family protein
LLNEGGFQLNIPQILFSVTSSDLPYLLPIPERKNHYFGGWFDNPAFLGEKLFQLDKNLNSSISLHAKWIILNNNIFNNIEMTDIIYSGSLRTSAVTSSGRVFTWGDNSFGALGDQTNIQRLRPNEITSIFNFSNDEIIAKFLFSESDSIALSSYGRVLTSNFASHGLNDDGSNLNGGIFLDITSLFELTGDEKIINVSIGGAHFAAISSFGRVFTWGNNGVGQLGIGNEMQASSRPIEITSNFNLFNNDKIISISLGSRHSSALSSTGRVFTWGLNDSFQLGNNLSINQSSIPIEITSNFNLLNNDKIISISLGSRHSSALSSTGRVFVWGSSNSGQVGDNNLNRRGMPVEITTNFNLENNDKISIVSLGYFHSSAVSKNGRVFTWGSNSGGELGNGSVLPVFSPEEITSQFILESDEMIINVSLGNKFSSATSSKNRIFTWGENSSGELGNGSKINIYRPSEIKLFN